MRGFASPLLSCLQLKTILHMTSRLYSASLAFDTAGDTEIRIRLLPAEAGEETRKCLSRVDFNAAYRFFASML